MLNDSSNTRTNMVLLKYGQMLIKPVEAQRKSHEMTPRSASRPVGLENMSPTVKYVRNGDNLVPVQAYSPKTDERAPAFANPEYMSLAELQKNIALLNRQYDTGKMQATNFGPPPSKKPPSPPHTPPVILPNDRRRRLAALPMKKPAVPIYQNVNAAGEVDQGLLSTPMGAKAVYLINKSVEEAKKREQLFADPIHVDVNFSFRNGKTKPLVSPNTLMRSSKQQNMLLKPLNQAPTATDAASKDLNSSMSSSSLLAGSFMSNSQSNPMTGDFVNSTSLSSTNNTSTSSTGTMIVRKSPSPGTQNFYIASRQLQMQQQAHMYQDELDEESAITKSKFLFQQTPQSQFKRFKQPHYQTQFGKNGDSIGFDSDQDLILAQTETSPPRFLFEKQPSTPSHLKASAKSYASASLDRVAARHSIVTAGHQLVANDKPSLPGRRSVPATFSSQQQQQQAQQQPSSGRENKLIASLSPIMTSSRADLHSMVINDVAGLEPSPPFIPASPLNEVTPGEEQTPKMDTQSRQSGSIKYRQLNFNDEPVPVIKRRVSGSHARSQSVVRSPEMPIKASQMKEPVKPASQVYNEAYFARGEQHMSASFGGLRDGKESGAETKFSSLPRAAHNAALFNYNAVSGSPTAGWTTPVDTSNAYDNQLYGVFNWEEMAKPPRPAAATTPSSGSVSAAAPLITYSPSQNSSSSSTNSSLSDSPASSPSSISSMLLMPPSPFKNHESLRAKTSNDTNTLIQITQTSAQVAKSLQPILITSSKYGNGAENGGFVTKSAMKATKKKTSSKKVSFLLSSEDANESNEEDRSFVVRPAARLERISEDVYSSQTDELPARGGTNELEYMRRHAKESSAAASTSSSSPQSSPPSASSSSSSPQNTFPGAEELFGNGEAANMAAISNTILAKIFNNNDYFVPSVGVASASLGQQAAEHHHHHHPSSMTISSTSSTSSSSSSGYKSFQSPSSNLTPSATFPQQRSAPKPPSNMLKFGPHMLTGNELDSFVATNRDRLDRMKSRRVSTGAAEAKSSPAVVSYQNNNNNNMAGSRMSTSSSASSPPGSLLTSSSGSSSASSQSPTSSSLADSSSLAYPAPTSGKDQKQIDSIIIKNVSAKIFQKILQQQQQQQKPLNPNGQVFGSPLRRTGQEFIGQRSGSVPPPPSQPSALRAKN